MMLYAILVFSIALGVPAVVQAAQWQPLPKVAPAPADNPTTPAKVELGKMLFFDPRLSSTGTVSCFSCHNVMEGGDDHRSVSMGVNGQKGGRNAPTVWNSVFQSVQFWDGRAASLEEQAKGPIVNPVEMAMPDLDSAVKRLQQIPGYRPSFQRAFGGADPITGDNVARAIAAYERTLITPDTPYDRYARGNRAALSAQQVRGLKAFQKAGCSACHSGPAFSGPAVPAGQAFFVKFPARTENVYVTQYRLMEDAGRAAVTKNDADKNTWRVPTLRNLAYTAPYFHNGSVKRLDEAVRVMAKVQLDHDLGDEDVKDIVAFLGALNGRFPRQVMPLLPPGPGDMLD